MHTAPIFTYAQTSELSFPPVVEIRYVAFNCLANSYWRGQEVVKYGLVFAVKLIVSYDTVGIGFLEQLGAAFLRYGPFAEIFVRYLLGYRAKLAPARVIRHAQALPEVIHQARDASLILRLCFFGKRQQRSVRPDTSLEAVLLRQPALIFRLVLGRELHTLHSLRL